MSNRLRVGVIGAGEGGSFLIDALKDNPDAKVAGLAHRSEDRRAVEEARELGIKLYSDFRELAESDEMDIIIDVSGNDEVEHYLEKEKKSSSQILAPIGTWLMWRLVEEQKKRARETAQTLAEQEVLYSAAVMLASAANTQQTLDLIMESALSITGMTAGSLALYEEEQGVMHIKASKGFEKMGLPQDYEWKLRPGGLTGYILSNKKPTVIEDLLKEKSFDSGPLVEMGVRSLIATPLKVSRKIVGILYVDDLKPRKFTEREVNILNLLGLQAAAAIDKAILLEKAEVMAITDGLTKLYNHRYFVRALEKEINRAKRYGNALSLCMIDVDYFKSYNDTYGHLKGNDVLIKLAQILRQSARETDVVARYGGEEFAVVLSQAGVKRAAIIAQRIREEVMNTAFPGEESQPDGSLTISIGVATYPYDATTSVDLIERSDAALYKSKERGRNVVTSFSEIGREESK